MFAIFQTNCIKVRQVAPSPLLSPLPCRVARKLECGAKRICNKLRYVRSSKPKPNRRPTIASQRQGREGGYPEAGGRERERDSPWKMENVCRTNRVNYIDWKATATFDAFITKKNRMNCSQLHGVVLPDRLKWWQKNQMEGKKKYQRKLIAAWNIAWMREMSAKLIKKILNRRWKRMNAYKYNWWIDKSLDGFTIRYEYR